MSWRGGRRRRTGWDVSDAEAASRRRDRAAALAGALRPKVALDLGGQLVPAGDLLVARGLQLLEQHPHVVVGLDGGIEPGALLRGVVLERAEREVDRQVTTEVAEQRQGGGRERPADVVGHLCVEA